MTEIKDRHGYVVQPNDDLNGFDFDSSCLDGANLSGRQMEGANFSDASMINSNLEGSDLYWAVFFRANLANINLKQARLCGANLQEANLTGADLREADFGRDNLDGSTDLQGANLTSCLIDGANFVGAIYSKETIFPVGFDPTCNEMVLHE